MAGKRRKGRAVRMQRAEVPAVRMQRAEVPAVRSLGDLQKLLRAHASKEAFKAQVDRLLAIGDAKAMRDLLRHQEEEKHWAVSGMEHLEVLAQVDGMIGHAGELLEHAIGYMASVAEAADPAAAADAEPFAPSLSASLLSSDDTAASEVADRAIEAGLGLCGRPFVHTEVVDPSAADSINLPADADTDAEHLVPALLSPRRFAREDTAALDLAGRMVEAGMGLCSGPLVPCAALVDLAARALHDEGPSGVINLAADNLAADPAVLSLARRMMEAGMGLCGGPLVPCAALLDLAARVLHDEGPSGVIDDLSADTVDANPAVRSIAAADDAKTGELAPAARSLGVVDSVEVVDTDDEMTGELADAARRPTGPVICFSVEEPAACIPDDGARDLFTRLLDAGSALRHHRLGSTSVQRAVQGLGAQIEDLSVAVLTCRHPPGMLLKFLHTVRGSLLKLRDSAVSQQQFNLM